MRARARLVISPCYSATAVLPDRRPLRPRRAQPEVWRADMLKKPGPQQPVRPPTAPKAHPRAPGCPLRSRGELSSPRCRGEATGGALVPAQTHRCHHLFADSTASSLCRLARLPHRAKLESRAAAALQPHLRGRMQRVHGPPLPPPADPDPETPTPTPTPTPTLGRRAWRCCSPSYSS